MKTKALKSWTVVWMSALTLAGVMATSADEATTAAKSDKTYTGTVRAVNPKERVLEVKGTLLTKKFNLGDGCAFTFVERGAGDIADLHPGQKVKVSYQDARGVLAASRVEQQPMRYEGTVKHIDLQKHIMTLHLRAVDKEFHIADGCMVALRNNKSGTLNDVKPGHYVTVLYEVPDGKATARQIAQTSATFSGTLTAIDMNERTVKAKTIFGSKKFNLGEGCSVVVNNKADAQLRDLRLGSNLIISYDEVNGVSVANRIGVADAPESSSTAQVMPPY